MSHVDEIALTYARALIKGSAFIALGVAVGVVFATHDAVAKALACAAIVVEIGSAMVVMRRGLRMVARMEREAADRGE